ncbi:hypothetical protein KUTeg_000864 [Tegillarca granosa]|uniref:Macro domain-containing protein n=1 Tax=Tegillarca granosa TaxID=220873 RepID=A0ABQ9FWK2_TEGGR|nr:hypothetical protein KUTeg_000864 [Tegillarca granosa]
MKYVKKGVGISKVIEEEMEILHQTCNSYNTVVALTDSKSTQAVKDEDIIPKSGPLKLRNGAEISLIVGDIAKTQADVLVCTVSHDLNLAAGRASSGLLKAGGDSLQCECRTKFPNGIKDGEIVSVKGGNLSCKEVYFGALPRWNAESLPDKCDVIVCGTSKELNLSAGKSCKNLLQFGGKKLQDECKKKYPEGIKEGEIAVVKGCGNLKCKEVYFGALPDWKTEQSKHRKMLWKFVESCMLKAHESGHSTIVFAALGTGALGYPPDRAAHLMYDSVIKFDNSHDTRSALKNVKFVVHYKDDQTIRVDVIACNVSPTLNLRNGKVTHALLTCEQSLQSECQQNYPYGINIGELAVIGPGNLPCKKVYLGVLPKYEEDEENSEQDVTILYCDCSTRVG